MPDILVRDLDTQTIHRLKAIAKQHGRSLQSQVRVILVDAITWSMGEARAASERWQRRLTGRMGGDSAPLIREDRNR